MDTIQDRDSEKGNMAIQLEGADGETKDGVLPPLSPKQQTQLMLGIPSECSLKIGKSRS